MRILQIALLAASLEAQAAASDGPRSAKQTPQPQKARSNCTEETIPFYVPATGSQLDEALKLLAAIDVEGAKSISSQGITFKLRRVHDLVWRSGVEGRADVDFDHDAISGSGVLPFRIEVSLEVATQLLKPRLRLTGPITVLKSKAKAAAGAFGDFLENNLGTLVYTVSQAEEFQREFSHQADASIRPPSVTDLVRALKGYLPIPAGVCVTAARLDEVRSEVAQLSVRGKVTVRRGQNCCD
jgi:hypothetical protein